MAKKSIGTITCQFVFEKKTPNTWRYRAVEDEAAVKTLYVSQSAFETMPDKLTVTITAGG